MSGPATAAPMGESARPRLGGRQKVGGDGDPEVFVADVVLSPAVAERQAATHAGTVDDEVALLVVHGILHVLGHDHAEPDEAATMRRRELELLETLHWQGAAPADFQQEQA